MSRNPETCPHNITEGNKLEGYWCTECGVELPEPEEDLMEGL